MIGRLTSHQWFENGVTSRQGIRTYTWTLRYAKRFFSVLDHGNRLLAYIRPVSATPGRGP
jgi:hypothetical protein